MVENVYNIKAHVVAQSSVLIAVIKKFMRVLQRY